MSEETGPIPGSDTPDSLRPGPGPSTVQLSPAGQILMNYLAAIDAAGDDADERYKIALSAIREKAHDVIIEIARQENHCRAKDYATRWGLIYAASELGHPAALPFFRSVVLTPISPEESPEPHSFSTVAEETILRTTAVDGVARLAADGSKEAIEALFDFLHVPSLSIKRAAVQGLMSVRQGESLRGRIEERLCPEDRFLLDIRPIDVRKVTQIADPEQDLSDEGRKSNKPIAPDLPDRAVRRDIQTDDDRTQRGDPPKGK
jgi:hypothetical protein